ncbi:hypothetical protein K438DRAFT_2145841 [Mycena galopus ATCC 62051]|nr:hypothetical protein K438DRAFT_2145841 [Mycena galopus ATCC 62051]
MSRKTKTLHLPSSRNELPPAYPPPAPEIVIYDDDDGDPPSSRQIGLRQMPTRSKAPMAVRPLSASHAFSPALSPSRKHASLASSAASRHHTRCNTVCSLECIQQNSALPSSSGHDSGKANRRKKGISDGNAVSSNSQLARVEERLLVMLEVLLECDEPGKKNRVEHTKHRDHKRRSSRHDSKSSMDNTATRSSGSKTSQSTILKGSPRKLAVPGINKEPEARAGAPRCWMDKRGREISAGTACSNTASSASKSLRMSTMMDRSQLRARSRVRDTGAHSRSPRAKARSRSRMRNESVTRTRSSRSNFESETSAESCNTRNEARLTDQEHHCQLPKHRAASRSRETSSIIKEKSKLDTPCSTTDASATASSIDEAEQASIRALETAYAAVDAARLRRVAFEERKRDLETQIAVIQARVALAEFGSTREDYKQSLKTAERLPTHATVYDQARQSSADNLQRNLASHHIRICATTTAVDAECRIINDEAHDVHSGSGGKPDAVKSQDGGGSFKRSVFFHYSGNDHTDQPVRSADGGEMPLASIPSKSVGEMFICYGDNPRRHSNHIYPKSGASSQRCGAVDSQKAISGEMGINGPSTAVVSVALQTKTRGLPKGATYSDPEPRSREIIAQSVGLCGGDIPSTEKLGRSYSKIAMHDPVHKYSTASCLFSPTTSSSCDARRRSVSAESPSSNEHLISLPHMQNTGGTFGEDEEVKKKESGETGLQDRSETRSGDRSEMATPKTWSPSVLPPSNRLAFPARSSSSRLRCITTVTPSGLRSSGPQTSHSSSPSHLTSAHPSPSSSPPRLPSSNPRPSYNDGFMDTAFSLRSTASPTLRSLNNRARDVPKPLTELHALSRSASPQAARRDYSERAFSLIDMGWSLIGAFSIATAAAEDT